MSDFLRRLIEESFPQQSVPGTPGINPNATDPNEVLRQLSQQNAQDPRSLVGGINDLAQPLLQRLGPVGSFISRGVDTLEQVGDRGRAAAERGVLGGIAPRFQAGVNAAAQRELDEAFRRAQIEIQRERNEIARITSATDKRRVQSTQVLGNGNLGVVLNDPSAPGGFRVVDTGQAAAGSGQVFNIPGLGVFKYDKNTDTITPIEEEEAVQEAIGDRARTQRIGEGEGSRTVADTDAALNTVPQEILAIDENIAQAEGFIEDLKSGRLDTGVIEGKLSGLTQKGQDFRSFSNVRVLDLISEATFGALSEGERGFLEEITFNLNKDEPVNIRDLERYIRIMKKARDIENDRLERARAANPDAFETANERLKSKGITIKQNP